MKTKAYKLRERIARYIYKRLQRYYYIEELKVVFGDGSWFVDTGETKHPRDYLFEWGDIEQSLGIIICIPLGEINGTVMWDKEKERKYTEIPTVHSKIWHNESRDHFALWKGR